MEVCAYPVADSQALELVEPRKRVVYALAGLGQAGAVRSAASGDLRDDARAQVPAVLAEVAALVGVGASSCGGDGRSSPGCADSHPGAG